MTRKSTARMKPSDKFAKAPELPPIEETFDNAKQAFKNTAEVAIVIAGRIDNLINIRKAYEEFWGEKPENRFANPIDYLKEKQNLTKLCYENIADIVNSFELEEFLREDMKDYFDPIMPKSDDMISSEDLFDAFLLVGIIKPWGEKMTALHHQMLDEQDARKPVVEPEIGK